ncbi:MAG: acyl-CoA dehydrogenase family protein, partial [Pseudomonadota bacterium]
MPLFHTDDQAMLADTASGFLAEEGNIAKQLRHWRDRDCKDGFGHALWKQMAEMGFTGMLLDEADGGLGLGHVEAGIVLEEIGRNLTPSPFLSSSVLAATAIKHGSADIKGRYLPGLVEGDAVYAVAIDETAKHRPSRITTKAEKSGNGFKLTGSKSFVVHGTSADMIVVAARTSGSDEDEEGLTVFAVPKDAPNMTQDPVRLVDSSVATHIQFDGVELDGDAVIGEVDGGREVLNAMLSAGRLGAAAEGVGVARGAMDMTVDYLKQRKQFGQSIGRFQSVSNRIVDMKMRLELARLLFNKTLWMKEQGQPIT